MSRNSNTRTPPPCLTSRLPSRAAAHSYVDQLGLDRLDRALLTEEQQAAALERQLRELQAHVKRGELHLERTRKQIVAKEKSLQLCSDLNRMQAHESKKRYLLAKVSELQAKARERSRAADNYDRQVERIKAELVVVRPNALKSAAKKKQKKAPTNINGNGENRPTSFSSQSDF